MKIWLLKDGETLPVQEGSRKMRTWMLADALADRGHEVVWWSSTFSHQRKELVAQTDSSVPVRDRIDLKMLHAGTYRKNVSVRRLLHHRKLARRFAVAAESEPLPDVIVSAYPIIEVASEALQFAKRNGIPIVVDVRDLWPDYFVDHVPSILRGPARLALTSSYRAKRFILQNADSVVATTEGILQWALDTGGRTRRPSDRPFYIGYPESTSDTESLECPDYLQPHQGRLIVSFVGIFGSAYDLPTVCRAARALAEEGDDQIHFVFGGTGRRFEEISQAADGLPNITLPGWMWKPQIESLLHHSDVGLVPFYDGIPDAMPNKVFEFLSAGLPLLSPLSGELRRLMQSSRLGLSYQDGDHESLLTQLRTLASNRELLAEMSNNARRVFNERFTAKSVYGAYAQHVEQLCESQPDTQPLKAAA